MRLLVLIIAVAWLMALVFFGLSVLLINIVGWLWPENGESQLRSRGHDRWRETN